MKVEMDGDGTSESYGSRRKKGIRDSLDEFMELSLATSCKPISSFPFQCSFKV